MRDRDIWADRGACSCGEALKRAPLKPFVVLCVPILAMCAWVERSNVPQDRFAGATRLQWNAVPDLVANVDVHLVGNPQGQVHRLLSEGLAADHRAVLEVDGQAVLGAPLGDLWQKKPQTKHKQCQRVVPLVRRREAVVRTDASPRTPPDPPENSSQSEPSR